ncbi:MAG: hypothetical protein ABS43_29545 [Bordetella sp. SCN 67-23]|nr:DUF2242 domain-containing protein [Burkholderiales bacterium]ODS67872.1 MAG: hypothetical protein ABS43_29545 [Bordetella sp. SCN 67-23]ODU96089.1 MAG: hypothetical protein ABT00_02745 [Bordetella sp. SCN 68-11]OJW91882.1 MAG: hypothetical protein BGO71_22290 [Burkholderiales bacterium 67-32]
MRFVFRLRRFAVCAAAAGALTAGCSAPNDPLAYTRNEFARTDTYSRAYPKTPEMVCEAGKRSLLSQGYTLADAGARSLEGHKQFQSGDNYKEITFRLVCEPDHAGTTRSIAFVNAVESTFALKKTNNSASVGVGLLGSVSMPFSSSDDSMVKTGSETIASNDFYSRFFALLEQYMPSASPAPQGEATPPAPKAPEGQTKAP